MDVHPKQKANHDDWLFLSLYWQPKDFQYIYDNSCRGCVIQWYEFLTDCQYRIPRKLLNKTLLGIFMPVKDRLKCYMSLGSLSNQAIKKTLYSASFNLGRRQEFENACSWLHSDEWKSKDWLIWAFISSQEESCGPHNKQSQISGSIRSVICVTKRAWLIYRVVWQITAIRHKISPNDSRWEAINQPNERAQ